MPSPALHSLNPSRCLTATTEYCRFPTRSRPPIKRSCARTVREAFDDGTPIYPLGGGTSLDFGLPPRDSGIGLSMQGLKRVVDYPARDMTITVEAGITIDALATVLAKEKQRLPIDLPERPSRDAWAGVIATNTSGARGIAHGTIRDYVIGITAVDGRGTLFHGGGRVVKNVAGYDFCKLLTGSLGTLGVITQVTLRVKPIPECSRFVVCRVRDWQAAERLVAGTIGSPTAPAAIELLAGPAWKNDSNLGPITGARIAHLLVGVEGTRGEVEWMASTLWNELRKLGRRRRYRAGTSNRLACGRGWRSFRSKATSPLVIKATLRLEPHGRIYSTCWSQIDPNCSIQSHAGNGIVIARMTQFGAGGLSKMLVGRLQPAAAEHGGHVTVLVVHQSQTN